MIKQKQLVPKRRFEGFKDEWKTKIFDELGSFGKTYAFSRANEGYGVYSHVHYGDIHVKYNGVINQNTVVPSLKVKGDFETLKKNDIVIADASEDYIDLGKTVVIEEPSNRKLIAGLHTFKFTPSEYLNAKFYLYYSQSDLFKKFSYKKGTGISVFGISKVNMSKMKLNIPLKNEQQKIGEFFKHLDGMIALEQRKIDKTLSLKSAYLAEMFPAEGERLPKRRFAGFTDEWRKEKLGNIGNTFSGLSGKTKKDFGHGDAEFITYLNVFNNPVSNINITENVEKDIKQDEVNYGDVLFTTSSETPHEVGMSSVWLDNRPNVYLNSFCFGYRINININYLFVAYLFRSQMVRKQMQVLAQGISRYNISKNKVMEITVLLPCVKEQKKIGEFFTNLDNIITTHEQKLEKLKATKQAYLHEMFV